MFCGTCGGPLSPTAPTSPTPSAGGRRRRLTTLQFVLIVVVVVAVVVGLLSVLTYDAYFATVHHSWSTTLATHSGSPGSASQNFPLAATVNGSWSVSGTGPANLTITTFGGIVYSENLTHGSFRFVSTGFGYTFTATSASYANVTVQVSWITHGSDGFGADGNFMGGRHASTLQEPTWPLGGPGSSASSSS
jgi:hypothetical protein